MRPASSQQAGGAGAIGLGVSAGAGRLHLRSLFTHTTFRRPMKLLLDHGAIMDWPGLAGGHSPLVLACLTNLRKRHLATRSILANATFKYKALLGSSTAVRRCGQHGPMARMHGGSERGPRSPVEIRGIYGS